MVMRSVATVFGGSGFIGRYVVKRLAARGYVVRVVGRDPERARFLMTAGRVAQVVPLYGTPAEPGTLDRAVDGAELVVNLIGILAERRPGDFRRVHAEGAGLIAAAAARAGASGIAHVSAIGADPASPSLYAKSKAEGEAAVRAAFPSATVLRPSVVFGAEDQFLNRFAALAALLPVMPVLSGDTRLQPVYVGDVADAVLATLTRPDAAGGIYELGGPRVLTMRELMACVLRWTGRRKRLVDVPAAFAEAQAWIGEFLPGKPLTRDQLLLLGRDNVAREGAPGLATLGIAPTPMDLVAPGYLGRFVPGGRYGGMAA